MNKCINCGSHAINHHLHGRDGSDPDLCDVCYWRKKAGAPPMEALKLLADIRKAVGDPTGKLGQDELVKLIDEKFNGY